jgi:hypothetical protein
MFIYMDITICSFKHILINLTSFMGTPNSMNSWCTVSLYSHFFSSISWIQKIWSVVDLLCRILTKASNFRLWICSHAQGRSTRSDPSERAGLNDCFLISPSLFTSILFFHIPIYVLFSCSFFSQYFYIIFCLFKFLVFYYTLSFLLHYSSSSS